MRYIEHAPTGDLVVVLDTDETARWRDRADDLPALALGLFVELYEELTLRSEGGISRKPSKDSKLTIRFADGALACILDPDEDED